MGCGRLRTALRRRARQQQLDRRAFARRRHHVDVATALPHESVQHVKTAIVMAKLNVAHDEATRRLNEADGVLVKVVGDIDV